MHWVGSCDFRGLPQSSPKSSPKSEVFDPKKSLLSHFSAQNVTLGVTFRVTLGETPKPLFSHFQATFNFSGFRGFWEVRSFTSLEFFVVVLSVPLWPK